ncbi:formate dehydrogenase accessory protein [Oxalobacteraceae bacterium]|jgi:FdhD protein
MVDSALADELTNSADSLKQVSVLRVRDGEQTIAMDVIAVEVPVALEYNGISHVVMLASPANLENFALGFSLSEGIIQQASELYACEVEATAAGWLVHLEIAAERFMLLKERRRNLAGRTGCGLCGTESLEQVTRCKTVVSHRHHFTEAAILNGMHAMQNLQPMQKQSGATHAAAWMTAQGQIECVREDVGRHNALDKLIGVMAEQKQDFTAGVLLITSRASYEMVQKAAIMNVGVIAAISAPTSFAVELAEQTEVTLMGFMRDQSYVVYTHADRVRRD